MKIQFGSKQQKQHNWEVYSNTNCVAIKTQYWQTLECAVAYAKILSNQHQDHFAVRWCKSEPIKPIKVIKKTPV